MRTALVTGGSRGIGQAIAGRLAADQFRVLTPSHAELDMRSAASIQNYMAALDCTVDVLVNDAGINPIAPLDRIADEDAQATLQINLLGPMQLARAVVPGMVQQNYGRIVNISSIWSLVGKAGRISYTMSKAGINGLTRTLAVELAPHNILVNAVAPGYVMTDLTRRNNTASDLEQISRMIPLQRLAEPQEIAAVVAFLCSSDNSYLTGQVITVDGGYTSL